MEYSQDEFITLVERVEKAGGDLLDKLCKAQTYSFTGKESRPLTLPSCGNACLFHVPYKPYNARDIQLVEVCAVEDDMGRWPRFGGDRYASPEHYFDSEDE